MTNREPATLGGNGLARALADDRRCWIRLEEGEETAAWLEVERRGGHSSFDPPGARMVFEVPQSFGFYEPTNWPLLAEFNLGVLASLRRCVPLGSCVYALDWQHACYRVFIHEPLELGATTESLCGYWGGASAAKALERPPQLWRVPFLAEGDYYLWASADFSLGTWGHPWEGRFMLFGAPLVEAVTTRMPTLLSMWTRLEERLGAPRGQ